MANKPVLQGGVQNYLGKQKQVTAPVKWKSSPDHPETELAYITKAEKNLLVKSDLHGSLKGGVNKGPSGIMSLNGYGSADESQNVSGVAASAAERGGGSGADRREVQAEFQRGSTGPALAPGAMPETARDFRSAAIAAGAGQRVNPGFFDSRDVISPEELARAKAYARNRQNLFAQKAMRRTRGGGLMNFLTGGGFTGNILRGLGRMFGLGKDFDEPTYDMRQLSGINPTFQDDLDNELALSTIGSTNTVAPLAVNNRVSPNVNLLAQPAYNLDGTVRDNAFGYFDLPDGYFDTNTNNINRNINDQIVPGGILDNVDIIDMQENENFGPMA
jgi:hypothetical protein